ncbi:hypothetical protein ACFWWT_13740 [Streptomyces sp. NPDC058676]|uniref:hypothetical protein n=1 Tax=unclassified Streptomyces TaxID=2593676 RepID=UPI003653099E
MRMRGGRLLVLAGLVLALPVAVACGPSRGGGGESDSRPPSPTPPRFDEEVVLADGRHVGLSYAPGRGLLEQHRAAGTGTWSEPHVVYETSSDPCRSMTVEAFDGTVAVIADWGHYCADGEPPTESVAAVGTTDLARWDTELSRNFDGWEKVTAVDGSRRLRFTRASTEWLTRLTWNRTDGFAEVEEIPR